MIYDDTSYRLPQLNIGCAWWFPSKSLVWKEVRKSDFGVEKNWQVLPEPSDKRHKSRW